MQYDKIAKSYKAQSVQTASPGKLVLMLFDGYLRFTTAAKNSFNEDDLVSTTGSGNFLLESEGIDCDSYTTIFSYFLFLSKA